MGMRQIEMRLWTLMLRELTAMLIQESTYNEVAVHVSQAIGLQVEMNVLNQVLE
jgi:hypothetical protein